MRRPSGSPRAWRSRTARKRRSRRRRAAGFGIVAAVEMLLGDVVERHLLGRARDSLTHLVRLHAELARDRVEHELEREADAGARDAAIGQDRRLVGGDRPGAAADSAAKS